MTKVELAAYLVSLHQLMQAQTTIGGERSVGLVAEYEKVWSQFKEAIKNDKPNDQPELPLRR